MATYASLKYDFGTQLTGEIPTAAIADDAITLAKMAGGTDGNLIGFDASGDPAAIATGTAGQVLTSAGANAASAMADAAGGGAWTFLQKQTASDDATISFSSTYITDTYPVYKIIVNAMRLAVDSVTVSCELSTDNGSSYASTYDQWQGTYNSADEYTTTYEARAIQATETSPHSGTTPPRCLGGLSNSVGNDTGEGACGELTFYNLRDSTMYPIFSFSTQMYMETTYLGSCAGWAGTRTTTDIDNIKFVSHSGNIATGTFTLYGLKDS